MPFNQIYEKILQEEEDNIRKLSPEQIMEACQWLKRIIFLFGHLGFCLTDVLILSTNTFHDINHNPKREHKYSFASLAVMREIHVRGMKSLYNKK